MCLCLMFHRKPTDIDWRYTEEGERVRVSVRTGRIIPKPVFQRKDGIIPQQWKGGVSEEGKGVESYKTMHFFLEL